MHVWSAVGAIGRMMMRAGVLILLFVAYQLWGTGLATSRAQDRLSHQFEQQLTDSATTPATVPGGELDENVVTAPTDLPTPEPGDPVGRLTIPTIDSDFIIVQGVDLRWLQEGPGHFPQTPLPGQPGNVAIAGHRTTYKAPFNRIDELHPGDLITATTLQGTFIYKVDAHPDGDTGNSIGHIIVGPNEVSILDQGSVNRLTLMACNPKYSAAQRIVVTATLTGKPAPPTPLPENIGVTTDASIDPLAGGDSGAWFPAIAWSILALGIWFGTWWLARRWNRIPAYLIGTPIFAVALFIAYSNIAHLLPASY